MYYASYYFVLPLDIVLALLILFRWPGFFAVLAVFGIVRQPSVDETVGLFGGNPFKNFSYNVAFSSSVFCVQCTCCTLHLDIHGASS